MAESDKNVVKIYGNTHLAERMSQFQKKAEEHTKSQSRNPFSGRFSSPTTTGKHDLNDPNYGRPVEGSKTDRRGKAAAAHIGKEVQELCRLIQENGREQDNGMVEITFKELFDMYQVISNKVVGVLLRARKHDLVHFEGEMLFQRRDDNVIITLLVDPDTIENIQDSTACVKTKPT